MKSIITVAILVAFALSSTSAFAWGAKASSKSSGYKAKSSGGSYKSKSSSSYKKAYAPKKSFSK